MHSRGRPSVLLPIINLLIPVQYTLTCNRNFAPKSGLTSLYCTDPRGCMRTCAQILVDFGTSQNNILKLRSQGYLVICYISGGTLEPYRADKNQFPPSVLGKKMADWDEWWFDIRPTNPGYSKLKQLIETRVKSVADKGMISSFSPVLAGSVGACGHSVASCLCAS